MRFVLVERPKYWHQSGVSAVIGTQKLSELCTDCNGSGLAVDPAHDPDCRQCHGTGERGVMDCMDGSYDGTEPCRCKKPARSNVIEAAFLGRRSM